MFTKLFAVMQEMEELPKLGKAPSSIGGFAYVRDQEVKEAVRAGFLKHRLMFLPECTGVTHEEQGKQTHLYSSLGITLVDIDTGHTYYIPWAGEALDPFDKASGKSATLGFKYWWLNTLMVATGEDPDGSHFEGGGQTGAPSEPAKALDDPGEYVMPITKEHKGKTLRQIANEGNQGLFQWVLDKNAGDGDLQANVRAYMDVLENAKSSESGQGQPTAGHWTETQDWQRFYTTVKNGLGLSNEDVHAALSVESAKDFKGSKEEAWDKLVECATQTVVGWSSKSELLKQWFAFLNTIPQNKRPSPAAAVKLIVEDGGNIAEFPDTLAVAMNIVRGKLGLE